MTFPTLRCRLFLLDRLYRFDLNFYSDSKYQDEFYSDQTSQVFNVTTVGTVGVDDNASITLDTKGDVPNNLYYNLQLKNKSSLTAVKLEIVTDDEVDGNNSINIVPSRFNGKKIVTGIGSTSFKIGIREIPEQSGYNSAEQNSTIRLLLLVLKVVFLLSVLKMVD